MQGFQKLIFQGQRTITDPETGRIYPVPAGGSEDEIVEALGTEDAEEAETPPVEESAEEEDDDDDEEDNLNAETFLQSIEDEELRQQLEPHVKRWDAGVTRRFQELHSRLRPYQELGEIETLHEAQQLYQILNENPERLYRALAESLGQSNVQQGQPGPQGQTPYQQAKQSGQIDGLSQQQYAQLPPEVQHRIEQQGQILTSLAEAFVGQEKTRQQQQEDEALESYLNNLKDEFGEFDEHYVLSKMANGLDGAKAVKQYHKTIQKELARRNSEQAPKVLSGGGQVQQESFDVGAAKSKDIKEMVAGLMAQASESGD